MKFLMFSTCVNCKSDSAKFIPLYGIYIILLQMVVNFAFCEDVRTYCIGIKSKEIPNTSLLSCNLNKGLS